ncbi:MAG: glycogen synthase [Clostridia bacterium]|nr:glycogen synthase [Clostridia bacterium]
MERPLKVLLAAAECAPFAKTGGLADVVGTLPRYLKEHGIDARVILPFHKTIKEKYATEHICSFSVRLGWRNQYAGVEKLEKDGVTFYFVDSEYYFGNGIYCGGDFEIEQYSFFARAVLEALPVIDFVPDVLQANDWHTAMIPMLIKTQYGGRPQGGVKTLLTIHNLAYQGKCGFKLLSDLLGIDERYDTPEFLELYGCADVLKAGCVFADRISTVSPSYAEEIRSDEYSEGLSGILRARAHETTGILNGIDTQAFDPRTDGRIRARYSEKSLWRKRLDKESLAFDLGLSAGADTPIVATISRFTPQKGFDLIIRVLDDLMREDICFVFLGQGDRSYEDFFRDAENRYRGRICSYIGFSEDVSHKIYAGADLLLMPSRFEPCGLSQMIAQRYGTLPVVRETGGLRDTVKPYNKYTGEGNGFSFRNYNAHEMADAVRYACEVYKDKQTFKKLMINAMKEDNGFSRSAGEYARLFSGMAREAK